MLIEEQWVAIDADIFGNQKLLALQKMCAHGASLRDAIVLLHERYAVLRERHPDKFTCSDEEYWAGFYS
jgi:hypothetical protein